MDFISLGTAVYYNGAFFNCRKTKKDTHYSIPKKKAKEFIDVILEMDNRADISIEVEDTWYSHKEINYEKRMKVRENPQQITYDELVSYDCTKILISDFDLPNELIEKYEKEFTIHITDTGSLIQIMSIDASKEAAVEYLINTQGIAMEDVMCFGNDFNDIGMFAACGYPVAMGNAVDELKQLSKEVTLSNDEEGVRLVLDRLI